MTALTAEQIDREPQTDAEYDGKVVLLRTQFQELRAQGQGGPNTDRVVYVTCPCGHRTPLWYAYKCAQCGAYFCKDCARRHFGMDRAKPQTGPADAEPHL